MNKIDKDSVYQWLGDYKALDTAVEILTDIYNGDYTVENLRNDFQGYFEPDDWGDINR